MDLHVHTRHSDGAPAVRHILKYAERKGFGFAITDHNEVSGIRKLPGIQPSVPVIPGIEIDCAEGPHILLYFYDRRDLYDLYDRLLRSRRRGSQYMTSCPTADQVITAAAGYACLKVAAHPFGYFCLERGVLKCAAKGQLPGVMDRLDGIEVICGGMSRRLNQNAVTYADRHHLPVTGGSDAHILSAIGSVVTGARAGSPEEFLDEIAKCRSIVHGLPGGIASRGMTGAVIGFNYIPYTATMLQTRFEPYIDRCREIFRQDTCGNNRR